MVGISRPLLNEIERGECNARLDSLIRISEGFDCEVWELMSPSGLTSRGDQL